MPDNSFNTYLKDMDSIPGWFRIEDAIAFHAISAAQTASRHSGAMLEIGTFAGKSAVALGYLVDDIAQLHVCDVFPDSAEMVLNSAENKGNYLASKANFIKNFTTWHDNEPTIYHCTSDEMFGSMDPNLKFRLIHIDGSHLYENAKLDAEESYKRLQDSGVISFDDYRSMHLGVGMATWEIVLSGSLVPVLATTDKLYTMKAPADPALVKKIGEELSGWPGLRMESDPVGQFQVMKLSYRSSTSTAERIARKLVPPVLMDMRSRIANRRTWADYQLR